MQELSPDITLADARDEARVFAVWEASVRATHDFLGEADLQFLIPLVREGLAHFTPIHCLRDARGAVCAFMGVHDGKVDMLFVHPDWRGRGAGRILMQYAIAVLGAREVDVNEQNTQAVGFYQHLGFRVVARSPLDVTGKPFPILHMALEAGAGNPWLTIPLSDYEAHMSLPGVAQAALLSDIFAEALAAVRPRSVAVVGCAGGNGFERVLGTRVERVVGIDINPAYIATARERYGARQPNLQLFTADIQSSEFECEPVDLVFAGLVFEYVDIHAAMRGIRKLLRPGGTLLSVVQMPGGGPEVTPSPYHSLRLLEPLMRLVDAAALRAAAAAHGLREQSAHARNTPAGKRLHVQVFAVN